MCARWTAYADIPLPASWVGPTADPVSRNPPRIRGDSLTKGVHLGWLIGRPHPPDRDSIRDAAQDLQVSPLHFVSQKIVPVAVRQQQHQRAVSCYIFNRRLGQTRLAVAEDV